MTVKPQSPSQGRKWSGFAVRAILTAAAATLWRFVEHWADVDFLLSLGSEKGARWFALFRTYGIWILPAILILALWLVRGRTKKTRERAVLIVFSIFAAMWGFLAGVYSAKNLPSVMKTWGRLNFGGACDGRIDTSRLLELRRDFDLILVCAVQDPTTDITESTGISVSLPFHITDADVYIQVQPSEKMLDLQNKLISSQRNEGANVVYLGTIIVAAVIPKGTPTEKITRLSDIERLGGRVLRDKHSEEDMPRMHHD